MKMITANNAYTYIFNYGYALGKDFKNLVANNNEFCGII